MNSTTPRITLEGVEKTFPGSTTPALKPLTATLDAGAVIGLVGPDGAGKTTLIRMLAGLLTPSNGTLRVMGLDPVQDDRQLHAILGYMPQKFGLYEDLSVMENLTLYADLRGITPTYAVLRAHSVRKPLNVC
ncbi:MAG: ATP-binding cassette domain-containing protein [Symbiopectobacterium sp.]|uniref:ATP-binding cassette domain-containing protein n=1 Tax=Symbiopectobacterium sp. TaxID=2952789 RepID=UPI0039E9F575